LLHKEAALHAAANGVHILMEKPVALNEAECDEIIHACEENNVCMIVCHTQQYRALNKEAKEIIESGLVGEIVMINEKRNVYYFGQERPDWFFHKNKAGGGIIINMGTHSVDKIQWLINSRVSRVIASISDQDIRGDIEGSGLIYMELEDEVGKKVPATLVLSGYPGESQNVTEIIGTKGKLAITENEVMISLKNQAEFKKVDVKNYETPSVLQLKDLISTIENNSRQPEQLDYARSVIAAIDAIYQSGME